MSDGIKIELHGARDLAAAFKELREFVKGQPLRQAVRVAAKSIRDQIASAAPVATGRLRENIKVKTRATAQTIRARVVVSTRGKASDPGNSFYWRFLELGFRTKDGRQIRYPFVEPVANARKQEAAQAVINEVGKAIDRAEKRQKKFQR
jgi:HK97 gp10 family phage protein